MPKFRRTFDIDENEKAYVFDYSTPHGQRQLISMSSCIYHKGRRPLTLLEADHPKAKIEDGHEFQGYIVKTKNGPYDYCTKLWDYGRVSII